MAKASNISPARLKAKVKVLKEGIKGREKEIADTKRIGRQYPGYMSDNMRFRMKQLEGQLATRKRALRVLQRPKKK